MRLLDLVVIAGIILALFGSKSLQSLAHSAGKGVGQAKKVKDELTSTLPVDEITRVTDHFSQIPLTPQQAVQKLITPDAKKSAQVQEPIVQAVPQETTEPI